MGAAIAAIAVVAVVVTFADHGSDSTPSPGGSPTVAPSESAALNKALTDLRTGVFRVVTDACGGGQIGTGFVISPTLVLTSARSVHDAFAISLTSRTVRGRTASVIGVDTRRDVALLRLPHPLGARVLPWSSTAAVAGEPLAVVGFGPARAPHLLTGARGATETSSGHTDLGIDLLIGSGGAPVIDTHGGVAGVLTTATGHAAMTMAPIVRQLVSSWSATPHTPKVPGCSASAGPQQLPVDPGVPDSSPATARVSDAIKAYYTAIDRGDYASAFAKLSARAQSGTDVDAFAALRSTTFTHNVRLHSVTPLSGGSIRAWVTFTSLQAAAHAPLSNETCDQWSIDIVLVAASNGLLIDQTSGHDGPRVQACP